MGGGSANWFDTGNMGMITIHLWSLGWGTPRTWMLAWDFRSGRHPTTASPPPSSMPIPLAIIKKSDSPELKPSTVLTYLLGERAADLTSLYGGMPARLSLQDSFVERTAAAQGEAYPNFDWANLNWDVVLAGLQYPDNPNHEEGDAELPGIQRAL